MGVEKGGVVDVWACRGSSIHASVCDIFIQTRLGSLHVNKCGYKRVLSGVVEADVDVCVALASRHAVRWRDERGRVASECVAQAGRRYTSTIVDAIERASGGVTEAVV